MSGFQFVQPDENSWKLDSNAHVWKFPAIRTGFSLLTPEEYIIAERFRLESDRNRFTIGRQALRVLISKYLSVRPMDIQIISEKGSKPFISSPSSDLRFNISHSGDWVLIALAHDDLGIDVEKINPEFDFVNMLEDHFSKDEQSYITAASDPVSAFYYLWTRKEALIKAWGKGLQDYMKDVSVLYAGPFPDQKQKSWRIESFQLSRYYPAALAYPGKIGNLIYFDGSAIFKNFMRTE